MSQQLDEIIQRFTQAIPERGSGHLRKLGREAEYPIVDSERMAGDINKLWEPLQKHYPKFKKIYDRGDNDGLLVNLAGPDFEISSEVGLGTVEIISRPCSDLLELKKNHEQAVEVLRRACQEVGYDILGYGIQPRTPPTLELMTPKQRYQVFYQVIGDPWLLFCVTASDQTHMEISRSEFGLLTQMGNLIAPVLIAFCANSPIHSGRVSEFLSSREGLKKQLYPHEHRHGIPIHLPSQVSDWVEFLFELTLIAQKNGNDFVAAGTQSFANYLADHPSLLGDELWKEFLNHDHYVWSSARPRTAHGTLESRSPCQQPWEIHWVAGALAVGLLQNAKSLLSEWKNQLGEDYETGIRQLYHDAQSDGLKAREPFEGFFESCLEFASQGLRHRGRGEEELLEPLYERLRNRRNPAQELLRSRTSDEDWSKFSVV